MKLLNHNDLKTYNCITSKIQAKHLYQIRPDPLAVKHEQLQTSNNKPEFQNAHTLTHTRTHTHSFSLSLPFTHIP